TSSADRYLQPGQACFVVTSDAGTPTLIFKEENKAVMASQTPVFRQTAQDIAMIRGTLYHTASLNSGGSAADGFVVLFNPEFSNDNDLQDASKPGNQDEIVGRLNAGKLLSIESRSMPVAEDILPLSATQYRGTDY